MRHRNKQRGSAAVEFALAGIPMIFVWISIVQMSIGMWHYHTLQYAVKQAGSYLTTHGGTYVAQGNSPIKIKNVAQVLSSWTKSMPSNEINVTLTAGAQSTSCRLDNCLTSTTSWPPTTANTVGTNVTISATWLWRSAVCMVAPGPGARSVQFGAFNLPGYTSQYILF